MQMISYQSVLTRALRKPFPFFGLNGLLWRSFFQTDFGVVKSPKKSQKRIKKGPKKAKIGTPKVNGLDRLMDDFNDFHGLIH